MDNGKAVVRKQDRSSSPAERCPIGRSRIPDVQRLIVLIALLRLSAQLMPSAILLASGDRPQVSLEPILRARHARHRNRSDHAQAKKDRDRNWDPAFHEAEPAE